MEGIRFTYINGVTCYILNDNLPYPFGKDLDPDKIIRIGDEILLMRRVDYPHFWKIEEMRDEISKIEVSNKWRSEERRVKTLKYYKEVLSLMTSYKRNITIDEVLTKENYLDSLCLAC